MVTVWANFNFPRRTLLFIQLNISKEENPLYIAQVVIKDKS